MTIIGDASPLIALATINQLDLIRLIYGSVIVPQAVYHEMVSAGQGKAGTLSLQAVPWIEVRQVANRDLVANLEQRLDLGEAEAIALAVEVKADRLLMDEHRGRSIAANLGLTVIGLLGVLLVAKRQGLIAAVKPLLDDLRHTAGFYVGDELYARVLRTAGEQQ